MRTLLRSRLFRAAIALGAIPVVAVGWWLASPLFINKTVVEDLPRVANPSVSQDAGRNTPDPTIPTADAQNGGSSVQMSDTVQRIRGGALRDGETFHKGSGQALILRLPDGSHVLRLEDLNVTNGPDLYVMLTPRPNPASASDVTAPGSLEVARLKGNLGSQNYPLPAGVDPASFASMVVYCKSFSVIFSVASLENLG